MPGDCKGVGSQGGLNLWVIEVDHCPLVCEHVHLQWNTKGIEGGKKEEEEEFEVSVKEDGEICELSAKG